MKANNLILNLFKFIIYIKCKNIKILIYNMNNKESTKRIIKIIGRSNK